MPNLTVNNIDVGSVILSDARFDDDTLTALGATPIVEGTLLGRTTASGKLGLFNKAGAGGLDVVVAVMSASVTPAGAGDIHVRPIVAGDVRLERLIIADGDPVITKAVRDDLRQTSIVSISVDELNILDNQ